MRRRAAAAAKPNAAPVALARLGRELADRLFLCTQNVDNLHEQAGSRAAIHMHGEPFKSRCDSCDRPPFATQIFMSPRLGFHGAHAVVGCDRTSVGLGRFPLVWT